MTDWYTINDPEATDSPSLLVFPERVQENIQILKSFLPETRRIRPHVKTHKSADISSLLIRNGISKFKCATIAEAEMLATAGAADVLLAYQPVGPKGVRLRLLSEKFPGTQFSCLIDNFQAASHLSEVFSRAQKPLSVFIDLNVGMNRTGIVPEKAEALYNDCLVLSGIRIIGLHAYDGHLRDADLELRAQRCNEAFLPVEALALRIKKKHNFNMIVVAGGTPTFPIHARRNDVECSPGTFVYWDIGYQRILKEQPYHFAALVLTRVISKPTEDTLCLDLGHKSIASENPIGQRVFFLNAPELDVIGHSEEHMVVKTAGKNSWQVGDVLYGVPFHVCPTCALYDVAAVVVNHQVTEIWNILSRKRFITV
jgi:D-serine deaminase-like pyridoxal phosphate-dependent protein